MEVNVEKNFNLGIKWRALGETSFGGEQGVAGGSYSSSSLPTSPGDSNLINPGDTGGFAMGIIHGAINVVAGGQTLTLPNLTALVEAIRTDEDIHILSTPQILTTDNEEARIVVGQNVPFQTRSSQISGTTDTFSSFEYRDVGTTLKITPQINKDRLIRLNISQEITQLTTTSEAADFKPTTLKRSFDTTVVVEDKSTIVIGGLIDNIITGRETSVPCLGDVPGLRWLFTSQTRGNQRTNLFVFLTPQVVTSHPAAEKIYKEKRERMQNVLKEGRIKFYDNSLYDDREGEGASRHPAMPPRDTKE
jgi:general secretion pathway protein D